MKIVSGGQTGVDRAALDVALELGMECGGWCPAGRWAEDGPIGARYPLRETPSADPAQRTEWNVRDSDATLILTSGAESGGTALTREIARRLGKPVCTFHAGALEDAGAFRRWLQVANARTLNVAGPRESEAPGIHAAARRILLALLDRGNEYAPVEALHPE